MPSPKYVVAVGDDACTGGIFAGTYAVLGGADKLFPVDLKIPGNPPTPVQILAGLLALMKKANGRPERQVYLIAWQLLTGHLYTSEK